MLLLINTINKVVATEHTLVLQQTTAMSQREAICQIVRGACPNLIASEELPPVNSLLDNFFMVRGGWLIAEVVCI